MSNVRFLILLAAAGAIAGCQPAATETVAVKEQLRAEPTSAKVERRDIVGYTLLPGELYVPPDEDAIIKAPYSAAVQQVMTTVGQRVGKGDDLIKMSTPDVDQSYAQASANVKAAETAYANAMQTYHAATKEADQQLSQARSAEKQWRLQATQTGDASGLNQAIEARHAAELAVAQARQQASGEVLPYKQQLDQAQLAYKQARGVAKQTGISAPISGTVLEVTVSSGQQVNTGDKLIRITDLGAIKVQSDISAEQAGVVKEGKSVVVTFMGLEDKPFDGTITSVKTIPTPEGAIRYRAIIDFKNDLGLVKPGVAVKAVGVKIGEVHQVLAVPAASVTMDGTGKPMVKVLKGDKWIAVVVETGMSDGNYMEIKSGVNLGDTVQVPALTR